MYKPQSIEAVIELLAGADYVADRALATVAYLALNLEKPLFVEGPPGVGKTELAVVLAEALQTDLIRLQCYEGLDAATALYEWNYPKQLLRIKLAELSRDGRDEAEPDIFSEDYLLERPLLKAIRYPKSPVLLIDELDRADEEFEAFLLEILADFQVSVPELGTLKAQDRPVVVVTSNRTREINDALKRRCLYHWIDYPDPAKELAVIRARLPEVEHELVDQVVGFLQRLRDMELAKSPGLAETLDWSRALLALHVNRLDEQTVIDTLGCILKNREDTDRFTDEIWSDENQRGLLLAGLNC